MMPTKRIGGMLADGQDRGNRRMFTLPSAKIGHVSASGGEATLGQRLLRGIDAISAGFGHTSTVAPHLITGLRGEEEAFFYLRRRGYVIVARRWKTPKVPGDVDLIAWEGETLCFIEVKTRTGRNIVPAEFSVDAQKQRTLRSMASIFRKRLPEATREQTVIRFDVVSVYLPARGSDSGIEIEVFAGAFSRHTR